jgi:transposase
MAQEKLITMTEKELSRYEIIERLLNKEINGTDAAKQIGLSGRQVRNLKARAKKHGLQGIIHAGRGKPGNRRMSKEKIKKIETIVKNNYADFGPTFAAEKLLENHQLIISKEKLRKLMIGWNLWKPKSRKRVKHKHLWRPRKDNFGEMEQFDGSYHHWFGKEESCLLLSVDDATGKITHARFDHDEGAATVFKFWIEYLLKNGQPMAIYLDKFSTYKVNHKNAVDNKDLIT